jgi:hypothetical protein
MRAPAPDLGDLRLADLLDADVCVLAGVRDVGLAGDLPLTGLVDEPVANPERNSTNVTVALFLSREIRSPRFACASFWKRCR